MPDGMRLLELVADAFPQQRELTSDALWGRERLMIIDSHGGPGALVFAYILFGVVIPVAPAMASAWWCSQLMPRISTKEAMLSGAATGTVAFFAWLFYSWPRPYLWLDVPTAACFAMAAISMVVTFILCYWRHNRKISPPD